MYLLEHLVLDLVEQLGLLLGGHGAYAPLLEQWGDVALVDHEAHKHALVGQLVGIGLGEKAVEHVVVLYGRVAAYGLKSAVVVGEHQTVGRNHYSRAVAREVYH